MLTIKIVLAVIGFSILMINGKMSHYVFSTNFENISYRVFFLIIGALMMLPALIHIIRSR